MKEEDIRPAKIFEKYLGLSAEDAHNCFDDVVRKDVNCPACGFESRLYEFEKHGFGYATCNNCSTLYQTPRPPLDAFERFYSDSASSRYWADVFSPSVAELRRERTFLPRVELLIDLCAEKGIVPTSVMDVGAGYGIFLEEWKKRFPDTKAIAIEPSKNLANVCRGKGLEVVENFAERVDGYDSVADLVVCFEVLEHVFDPIEFIRTLKRFVKPGGYLMVSTLTVTGFDIQVLWDKSNSVSPPHHINFLSVEGFKHLFSRAGLVDVDVLTPGVLDVDIVINAYKKDPSLLSGNRFVKELVKDDAISQKFQQFLAEYRLSSHAWVLARKECV